MTHKLCLFSFSGHAFSENVWNRGTYSRVFNSYLLENSKRFFNCIEFSKKHKKLLETLALERICKECLQTAPHVSIHDLTDRGCSHKEIDPKQSLKRIAFNCSFFLKKFLNFLGKFSKTCYKISIKKL